MSAATPDTPTLADWLTERGCNHAANLLALFRSHENRVETLGCDHGVGEGVNRRWRVVDDSLLVLGRQAVAELYAEIVQKLGCVHGVNGSPRSVRS